MANHHHRSDPYLCRADVGRHFAQLEESQATTLSLTHPIDDIALFGEVLERAREQEITIRALHTQRAAFLRDDGPRSPLTWLYRPHDPIFLRFMPLEAIVFDVRLDHLADYQELSTSLELSTFCAPVGAKKCLRS